MSRYLLRLRRALFLSIDRLGARLRHNLQTLGARWDTLGGVTPQRWVKLAAGN